MSKFNNGDVITRDQFDDAYKEAKVQCNMVDGAIYAMLGRIVGDVDVIDTQMIMDVRNAVGEILSDYDIAVSYPSLEYTDDTKQTAIYREYICEDLDDEHDEEDPDSTLDVLDGAVELSGELADLDIEPYDFVTMIKLVTTTRKIIFDTKGTSDPVVVFCNLDKGFSQLHGEYVANRDINAICSLELALEQLTILTYDEFVELFKDVL